MNGLAIESRSLEQLKLDAARDPKSAVRKAATQFEAMFLQMVLKSMRDAMPQSGLTQDSSSQMYTGMLDSQLSQKMAGKGMGLAEVLTKQLSKQISGKPAADGLPTISLPQATTPQVSKSDSLSGLPSTANLSPSQRAFVERLWEPATAAERTTGVPALFVIGQAALETGWGKHEIKDAQGNNSFNLFGIKAGASWKGATVSATTTEYKEGTKLKVVEQFRAYGSYAESIGDWARLMSTSPRYGQVIKTGGSASEFAQGMQRAGYATDPAYATKLQKTIEQTLQVRRLVV